MKTKQQTLLTLALVSLGIGCEGAFQMPVQVPVGDLGENRVEHELMPSVPEHLHALQVDDLALDLDLALDQSKDAENLSILSSNKKTCFDSARAFFPVQPPTRVMKALILRAGPLTDDWYRSTYIGDFYNQPDSPWLWSNVHGWMALIREDGSNLWFYTEDNYLAAGTANSDRKYIAIDCAQARGAPYAEPIQDLVIYRLGNDSFVTYKGLSSNNKQRLFFEHVTKRTVSVAKGK